MKYDEYVDIASDVLEEFGFRNTFHGEADDHKSLGLSVFLWADAGRLTTKNDLGEITPIGKVEYGPGFDDDLRSLVRKFKLSHWNTPASTSDASRGEAKS
ncbi:hypothetical protein [Symmachiella dynata]|uniref:hypothetical protein n=1 Tax=Symmachiella dynata TaxID=2527995 RepID=UPI0030ECDED8